MPDDVSAPSAKNATLVERGARAICLAQGNDPDQVWVAAEVANDEPAWWHYQADARAVLAAIREPTEAMCAAAADDGLGPMPGPRQTWRSMVDAALAEGGGQP